MTHQELPAEGVVESTSKNTFRNLYWPRIKQALKLIISLGLISFLIYQADWANIKAQLSAANLYYLLATLSISSLLFPISTWKWRVCLEVYKLDYQFMWLQKILCIGFFFNNFLPTSIGGDSYRIVKTMPREGYKSRAVSAVLLERIVGLIALLMVGFIYSIKSYHQYPLPLIKIYMVLGSIGIALSLLAFILYSKGVITSFIKKNLSGSKWVFLLENLRSIHNSKPKIVKVVLISVFFHLLGIYGIYLLFRAFGVDSAFAVCALIAVFKGIATMIPISFNGIGVVEGAFVYVATLLEIPFDQAVIVAFMLRVLTIPFSVLGGGLYLFQSKNKG